MSMMQLTEHEFLIAAICFLLMGFIVGLLLSLVLIRFFGGKRPPAARHALYTGDVRQTVSVLQQLQAMIGRESAEHDPSLADLVQFLHTAQHHFGRAASLEGVIQALVARDIEQQLACRKRSRRAIELSQQGVDVHEKVVVA